MSAGSSLVPRPRYSHTDPMLGGSPTPGPRMLPDADGPLTPVMLGSGLWSPPLWLTERTIAERCIHRAVRGSSSHIEMPGTEVAAGLNTPPNSARAPGLL